MVRGLQVGGNANNGSNAGLAYLNANNAPSNANANYGSRLNWLKSFHWGRDTTEPCHMAKNDC